MDVDELNDTSAALVCYLKRGKGMVSEKGVI